MSEPAHDDELAALQAALGRLAPTPDGIDIGRLLFRAGQASVPRRNWGWPCATAASAMLAVALGAALVFRPPQRIVNTVVVEAAPRPPEPRTAEPPPPPSGATSVASDADHPRGDSDYLQLRREVLARGVDALPPPTPWPAAAPARDDDPLLEMAPGAGEPQLRHLKHSLQSGDAS
jgi:hypothetical protein